MSSENTDRENALLKLSANIVRTMTSKGLTSDEVVGILVRALVCVLHTSDAPIDIYETAEVIRRLLIDMDAEFGSKILN